jgi:hypothetical protein
VQGSNIGENDGGGPEEARDRVRWGCSHGGEDGWGCCRGTRDGLEEGGKRESDCSNSNDGDDDGNAMCELVTSCTSWSAARLVLCCVHVYSHTQRWLYG